MNDKNFDDLINDLTEDLTPVKRIAPLWQRLTLFILPQLAIITMAMVLYSDTHFNTAKFSQSPLYLIQCFLFIVTLITAVVTALLSTIPGRIKLKSLWLPVFPLAALIVSILMGYQHLEELEGTTRHFCEFEIFFIAIIPFTIMMKMLNKGFFISENASLLIGAFASALLPTAIMHLTCDPNPTHVLLFHFLPLFLFSFIVPKIYFKFIRKPM